MQYNGHTILRLPKEDLGNEHKLRVVNRELVKSKILQTKEDNQASETEIVR